MPFKWIPAETLTESPSGYVPGRCAICKEETGVKYCGACKAVICPGCRHRYFSRGLAAVKTLFHEGYHGEILVKNASDC
jgi:hypothetical protein